MRRIQRLPLATTTRTTLRAYRRELKEQDRQRKLLNPADVEVDAAAIKAISSAINAYWENRRSNQTLAQVLGTLKEMAGPLQKCMYCQVSIGSDIDHFYPKSVCALKTFQWGNLFLCCPDCGRYKGKNLPVNALGRRYLLNPCLDDPWDFLDFEPDTGALIARPDAIDKARADETVRVFRFHRREALNEHYKKGWQRLQKVLKTFATGPAAQGKALWQEIVGNDDLELRGWLFRGNGKNQPAILQLRTRHPELWEYCLEQYNALG